MQFNSQTGSFHLIFILLIPAWDHQGRLHGDGTDTPPLTFLLRQYSLVAASIDLNDHIRL